MPSGSPRRGQRRCGALRHLQVCQPAPFLHRPLLPPFVEIPPHPPLLEPAPLPTLPAWSLLRCRSFPLAYATADAGRQLQAPRRMPRQRGETSKQQRL